MGDVAMSLPWLPPLRKYLLREETTANATGSTYQHPKLNDLDPSDPAVVALTTHEESRG